MVAVSIVVPVYNVEKYLIRCLESLVNQQFDKDYEIICVNDGSTDSSELVLKYFAQKYKNLKIISQENKGLSEARNEGMKHAQGKYTLFVDSDDFIAANALQLLYDYAEKHNSDVVIFDIHMGKDDLTVTQTTRWQNIIDKYGENSFNIHTADPFIYRFVPVAAWNKLYRTDLIKDLKFIKGITREDVPYWTLVYSKAQRVNYLPLALYFYVNDRQNSISNNDDEKVFDIFTAFEAAKQSLMDCNCYEKLKYVHWAHFASNLFIIANRINGNLKEKFIQKIKELDIDIDIDEFDKQDFFPFEKRDVHFIKDLQQ
jgi:glycosyltransferase involved in cell wall biosynthesis